MYASRTRSMHVTDTISRVMVWPVATVPGESCLREVAEALAADGIGAVGVVQLDHPVDVAKATEAALEQGVWLRPFRDLIYTMPPYVCSDDDIATICAGIAAAAEAG